MGLLLTSEQVATKLGVSRGVVIRLVRTGQLAPVNKPAEGKKRVEFRFDSKAINEFKKSYVPRGHGGARARSGRPAMSLIDGIKPLVEGPGLIRQQLAGIQDVLTNIDTRLAEMEQQINTRLTQLEAQLAALHAMWS